MSPLWHLEFWDSSWIFGKLVHAWCTVIYQWTIYKVWSVFRDWFFFTRLWVYFGIPLFAGWCPRTSSLPGTRDGPRAPLSPLWASVKESCVPAPRYFSCRAGCRKSKSSACIKFCVKLGRNGAETFQMLRTAFGEQCLSHARTFEWHAKCGQKSKSCSLFSLIWRALFIMSTFHKAKL